MEFGECLEAHSAFSTILPQVVELDATDPSGNRQQSRPLFCVRLEARLPCA